MFQQQGIVWRGGFLLLFLGLTAPAATTDDWLTWVLKLEKTSKSLFTTVMGSIRLEDIKKAKDPEAILDQTLLIQTEREQYKVSWDSKKSGILPGPQATKILATIQGKNTVQYYEAFYEQKLIDEKEYFKTSLRFAISQLDGKPLRRGFAEVFQDVQRQRTKISTSTIEGPSDILPADMVQINLQATVEDDGAVFLRKDDEGDPLHIPKGQKHFCKNREGEWISRWSSDWKKICDPLFDNSIWHGFSFSSIPSSYEPFAGK